MSLAESLLVEFRRSIDQLTLAPGVGGVFDVAVDGDLVFSKHHAGGYPTRDEIKAEIRRRLER